MQLRISGLLGVMAALAAAAGCKKDPTADLAGTPTAIQAEFATLGDTLTFTPGNTGTFTAWVIDARFTRLVSDISFGACDATKASVAADASYNPVPATSSRAIVSAVSPGNTCAVVSSGSLKPDTVTILVARLIPTLSTTATPSSGTVGVTVNDKATLGGGFGTLSGTIVFKLYDPTQATCPKTATPRYTQTVTVNGTGTYSTSPGFVTDKAGTWRWTAAYSGDGNNYAVKSGCDDEKVTVS